MLTTYLCVQEPTPDTGGTSARRHVAPALRTHKAIFSVGKGARGAHKYSVSGVLWYPVDTGLFVTGSFDNDVKASSQPSLAGCFP